MNIFLFYNSFILDLPNGLSHQIRSIISEAFMRGDQVTCIETGMSHLVTDDTSRVTSGSFVCRTEPFNEEKIISEGLLNSADVVLAQAEVQPHILQALVKAKANAIQPFLFLLHDRQARFLSDPFLYGDVSGSVDGVLHRSKITKNNELSVLYLEDSIDDKVFYPRKTNKQSHAFCMMANRNGEREETINQVVDKLNAYQVLCVGERDNPLKAEHVTDLGWQENIRLPEILTSASVYLDIPSGDEQHEIRLPVLEAGACGLPVVSMHESPVLEKGRDYLYAKNVDEMVRMAEEVFNSDVLKTFLSQNIQRKINRQFTSRHRFKELERFISSIRDRERLSGGAGAFPLGQNIQGRSPVS